MSFPDIGKDPLKLNGDERMKDGTEGSINRLREAVSVQQTGVPDQTMLAWRIDVSRVIDELLWRRAAMKGKGLP